MKADIQLLFGVLGGGELSGASGKKIHGQLTNIANQINRNPFKIRFQAEEKSLERMRGNIAKILNEFNTGNTFQFNTGVQSSNGLTQITQVATKASSAVGDIGVAINNVNLGKIEGAVSKIGGVSDNAISNIVSQLGETNVILTEAEAKIKDIGSENEKILSLSLKGVNAAGMSVSHVVEFDKKTGEAKENLTKIAAKFAEVESSAGKAQDKSSGLSVEYKKAKGDIDEYYKELKKVFVLQNNTNIKKNEKGIWYAEDGVSDESQVKRLNRLLDLRNEAIQSSEKFSEAERIAIARLDMAGLENFNIALEELNSQTKQVTSSTEQTKNATSKTSKEYTRIASAVKEYYSALMGIRKVSNIKQKADGSFYSVDGKNNLEDVNEINRRQEAYRNAMIESKNLSEKEIENIQKMDAALAGKYSDALNKFSATKTIDLASLTTEYSTAIGKAETGLKNWTAAEKSHNAESRNAYNALKNQIAITRAASEQYNAGKMSPEAFAAQIDKLNQTYKTTYGILKQNGHATKSFGDKLKGLAGRVSSYFGAYQAIMYVIRAIRNMVNAITEIDTAMTELKKVTNETDATYKKFLNNASVRAKALGATVSDVVNASADFARLGYNLSESEKLADAAIIYKNVGDGIENISDASKSIIATMQAFGVEANDVMTIVDKFNKVGNNFAISSKGVGDALLRSASAMQAANNTLDETIALATAANTTVQNAETVGTALKTVSMYLRAAKTEAEDAGESTDGMASSISELRGSILSLTGNKVDIQIDNDTFKSTYQILKELSEAWDKLTDVSKANILEMIGGKRNSNIVAAILENFQIAEDSLKTSANSSGSAFEENEKYLDSVKGKMAKLKSDFETFSNNFIGSDTLKVLLDIGSALMTWVNSLTKINMLLPTIIASIFAIKGVLSAKNTVNNHLYTDSLINSIVTQKQVTGELALAVAGLNAQERERYVLAVRQLFLDDKIKADLRDQMLGVVGVTAAEDVLEEQNKQTALSFQMVAASTPVWGWISMAISAILSLGVPLISWIKNSRKSLEDLKEEYKNLSSEIQSTASEFASLKKNSDKIIPRYAELSQGVNLLGEKLSLTDEEFAEYISLNNQLGEMFPGLVTGYDEQGNAILALAGDVDTLTESLNKYVEAQRMSANEKIADTMPDVLESSKDIIDKYKEQIKELNDQKLEIESFYKELKAGRVVSDSSHVKDGQGNIMFSSTPKEANERAPYYDYFGIEIEAPDINTVGVYKYKYKKEDLDKNYKTANLIIDKQIAAIVNKIESTEKSINPVVNAWLQTDVLFNELGGASQDLASMILSELNFSDMGLTTEEQIKDYVDKHIIRPLYNLEKPVREKFETLVVSFNSGAISAEDFKSGMVEVYDALSDDEDFKSSDVIRKFVNNLVDAKKAAESAEKSISSFKKSMSGINNLGDGLDILGDIYSDIKDSGDFDWSSILDNEDFEAKFGSLGETYDEFIKTVANSPNNINACQSAFNKLTTEYIINSGQLQNVTEETKKATIALLKQKGVANAAAIVDAQLEKNKAKLKYTTGEYADATAETYLELLNSAEITKTYRLALLELAAAKILNSETPLSTEEDINQLIRLAATAGIATDGMRELLEAKELNTEYDRLIKSAEYYESKGSYDTAERYREQAEIILGAIKERKKDVISDFTEQLNEKIYGDIKIDYTPKDVEDETWFEKEYNKHQHLVAMEQETQKEYLDWLDKAYKKAYDEKIITLDDYRKYEEEVFEGLRELFQTDLDEIIYQADSLEKRKDTENKRVALYREAQNKILEEMQRQESLGSAANADYIKELKDQWWDLADNINSVFEAIGDKMSEEIEAKIKELEEANDLLNQEKSDWETAIGYATDVIESRIEQIQRRKEALEEENDEKERAIELEKLQMALENAKRNKNIRVYYEDKGFVWETDKEAISEAQKELDDFYKDEKVRALDEQIKYWEKEKDKWSSITSDYERNQNKLIAMQQFGYDITNKILAGQSDSLIKNARQHYTSVSDKIRDNEKEIKSLEELQTKTEEFVADQIKFNDDLNSNLMEDAKNRKDVWDKMILDAQDFVSRYNSIMSSMAGGDYASASNSATTYYWKGNKVDSATVNKWKNDGWTYVGSKNGGTWSKNGVETFASGTKNAPRGLAIVDEEGSEAIAAKVSAGRYTFLNGGEQIFTAEQTKRLWELVQQSPLNLFKNIGKALSVKEKTSKDKITPLSFNISNLVLQDVNNPSEFVAQLKRYAITHSNT